MGLGPPVCTTCKIILAYVNESPYWYCPICQVERPEQAEDIKMNLWELSAEDQKLYERNSLKLKQEILTSTTPAKSEQKLALQDHIPS